MKKYLILIIALIMGLILGFASGEKTTGSRMTLPGLTNNSKLQENLPASSTSVKFDVNFGKIPLYFISNKGQVHEKAKFYAKASRYTLWLTKEGLVFDSVKKVEAEVEEGRQKTEGSDVTTLIFLGANKNPAMVPMDEKKLRVNYFKGKDKSRWHCDIPTSGAVLYKDLYKNIDLKVYGIEKQIEYDWIVKPGGNPGDIRFKYNNVKGTRLDEEGNLIIETRFGELIHKKPASYQERKAQMAGVGAGLRACPLEGKGAGVGAGSRTCPQERKEVDVTFKKINKNTYAFEVGQYDKNDKLIIDPVVLAYSTYLGKGDLDWAWDMAVDNNGNVYVTGFTENSDFPLLNQYQGDRERHDAFVSRLDTNQSGTSCLIYSTYLGGDDWDRGIGIAVDGTGNAYVVGITWSSDFPTLNQYQGNDGNMDAFVVRLDTNQVGASSLIYSTYLGGGGPDSGRDIVLDVNSSGIVYVTGDTDSGNFPILNQYQGNQGSTDAYVTVLDTNQSGAASLIYSTYLGGSGRDNCHAIAVDSSSNAYVTGFTEGTDFPTLNQYQEDPGDGRSDVFVSRLDTNQSGSSCLIYSTYLGGNSNDNGISIKVDDIGNVYVTGYTSSTNFPTFNQYQGDLGDLDSFVTRLDTNQSGALSLIYSTYLGGERFDRGYDIALDVNNSGIVHVTGYTTSRYFPTLDQYQGYMGGGDIFITGLDTNQSGASCLVYSSYLGGRSEECSFGIGMDNSGNIYVAGYTESTDFPTLNQYQDYQGRRDAFVTKFSPPLALATVTTNTVTQIRPTRALSGGNVSDDGGAAVTSRGVCWSTSPNPTINDSTTSNGTGIGSFTSSITGLTANTTYYLRAYATNSVGTAYGQEEIFRTTAPVITVVAPNGGEECIVGSEYTITWNSEGVENNISIQYSTNNGSDWTEITASTVNTGLFRWLIPDSPSTQCLVRISEINSSAADTSDHVFTIYPVPDVTVTSPNGGETWQVGSQHQITWTSIRWQGNVNILYSTNNGTHWTEIVSDTENDGSYLWTVPNAVSDQCLIGISDTWGRLLDTSDHVFSIGVVPTITITSPNGGETWQVGSQHQITWTSTGNPGNVNIQYSTDNGALWLGIVSNTQNDGSYLWTVPNAVSDQCLVRVSEVDGSPFDISDNVFSIEIIPAIIITSPNGGENWQFGTTQNITWIAPGISGKLEITLWKKGKLVGKIAKNIYPTKGDYPWLVGNLGSIACPVGTDFKIKIKEMGTTVYDMSDNNFTLYRLPR